MEHDLIHTSVSDGKHDFPCACRAHIFWAGASCKCRRESTARALPHPLGMEFDIDQSLLEGMQPCEGTVYSYCFKHLSTPYTITKHDKAVRALPWLD